MIDLKQKLDGVVKPKKIARIEQALQERISPYVTVDSHIATSVVKGLLIRRMRYGTGKKHAELSSGYCTLYREKRKGQQFIGGRCIKFYAARKADKVAEQANAVFEALGINAVAEAYYGDTYAPVPSIRVIKRDASISSSADADIMKLFA